ncbi:proline-rich receptor-like protein kinase PERK15 [Primulina tabacum]|uniref:proline-rich receptor-like protein kinase PERK15 n=1 Tax=Primulina tabacum TaxID=48773 RepID=UPI003F592202
MSQEDASPPSNSSSPSPPPQDSSDSSPPPPPPSPSDSSTSPPPKDDSSSPPPPDNGSDSPSPPSPSSDKNSPPPPPNNNNDNNHNNNDNNNNSPPPNNNNDNNNNNNDNNNNSPPSNNNKHPPPPKSSSSDGFSPPPPPSSQSGSLPPSRDQRSSNDESSNGPDQKAIIGGAAAGAGLLLFIVILFMICCARRKKRRARGHMHYYTDNSLGHKSDIYYNNVPPHGNWNPNGRPSTIPPPPGSGNLSSELGWPVAPPPPPPMMSSSELSSSGFSGPHQSSLPPPHPAVALGFNQSSFTYNDLSVATGGFSQANLLGQGGFGFVHKGILPNGKEVAVKSLKSNSSQGEREFQAEVDIISRVHHRHLVSLVGYCIAGSQRMLVYEYVPNGTLEFHLLGSGRPTMDFHTRLRIAIGSAKGFAYLHEDCHPRIIHRDIKTANILLDYNFEAKVADFGLAKLSSDTNTHVSTRIMGTFGYLAPEYASTGKLTEKSDVYSYGIMLLELITGRRPIDLSSDDDSLVDWARPILIQAAEGGSYEELVDPRLENNYDHHVMLRMVASAAACIRHSARRRPKMSQIVRALEGDVSLEDLNEGVRPGHSRMFGSNSGSEYDSGSYTDLRRFKKVDGMSSQEFTSSGEHGLTGEFVHPNKAH